MSDDSDYFEDEEEDEDDPLRLARLAIFCAVFGAAILLGLTLSIARQKPPARLTQKRFIEITVTAIADEWGQVPLINFRVTTPDGVEDDLPLEMLSSRSLRDRQLGEARLAALDSSGAMFAPGLSYFGEGRSEQGNTGLFEIVNPTPREWKIAVRCCGALKRDYSKPFTPKCRVSVVVSGQPPAEEQPVELAEGGTFCTRLIWMGTP